VDKALENMFEITSVECPNILVTTILIAPKSSVPVKNTMDGTLERSPAGEIVPKTCAVMGAATNHAHAPVIHAEIIRRLASVWVVAFTSSGPRILHFTRGSKTKIDATTKKLS
jgi:hypothetical protein